MRQCEIYLHEIKCGILAESDSREYSFTHDKEDLIGEYAEPVSLTLPLWYPHGYLLQPKSSLTEKLKHDYIISYKYRCKMLTF